MSKKAWLFVSGVLFLGLLQMAWAISSFKIDDPSTLLAFAILTSLATFSQVYEVEGTFRNTYYPHSVFFMAASLLFSPLLFTLVVLIPHTVEWVFKRLKKSTNLKAWYIQPFNVSTHILAGTAVHLFYQIFIDRGIFHTILGSLLVILLAFVYAVINHFLIGMALLLARGLSFFESGVMKLPSILPDITLGCLGYLFVSIWHNEIYMIPIALVPLVLMYQVLKIPQLTQDAQLDAKTGLLNAKYFNKIAISEFDEASRNHKNLAFLMADIDLMRDINNTYGHLAGDAALAAIGKVIRQIIPDEAHAARFGGEEFAVIIPNRDEEETRQIGEAIRKAVEEINIQVDTHPNPIKITMSLGIAHYPFNAKDLMELTYKADLAVYQAKKSGRNRLIIYSELSNEEIQLLRMKPKVSKFKDNSELELQIRQGLDEGQFELYYQPKVDTRNGTIKGVEALVRWQHPKRGTISPAEFIPLAEENGLILPLGKWIIEEACRQVKTWNTFSRRYNPITVSINVSAIQFQREDVNEIITTVLRETGAKPGWIEIEITEGILMENSAYTIQTLKKLKELGVKLAMDDFGIGYSSLSYLKNFPIDTLKIDRSFVVDLDKDFTNQALIEAIVGLSKKMGFNTIAEGIETEEERDQLIQLGCFGGQGYLFGKPMTALSIDNLFKEEKSNPQPLRVLAVENSR
jgi:diguanylate cyclase (GGDEF)-like protein